MCFMIQNSVLDHKDQPFKYNASQTNSIYVITKLELRDFVLYLESQRTFDAVSQ